jgi:RNA polymerase sigma-70 factor, ECF subfamily
LCGVPPFASLTGMPPQLPENLSRAIEALYRAESGRILATLVRLLGDLDVAEEAMHEAFAAALDTWPQTGVPEKPRPWLISTARFKAIDGMRRRARFNSAQKELSLYLEARSNDAPHDDEEIEDDRLRLIFTSCHPALPPEAHVALTLREVCGLTTEEIAKAFLTTPRTLAQRIVRAKAKIREASIPYEVPSPQELPARLGAVLQVVYRVFNEGYSAAAGREVMRAELTGEAIRLGRLLTELRPEPEVLGLLSLMLLRESRHAARTSPTGELILLENQDRLLWNQAQIAEGVTLLEKALNSRRFGSYTLQAAIAAVHAQAESVAATDWRQIVALYDQLLRIQPSPVVQLNRAVAIAMCDGPEAGLANIDALLGQGELADYYLAHSARADMYRRLGRAAEARSSYEKALALTQQEPERQFRQERIRQLK